MITTNLLFACLGVAFIAFGLVGMKDGFAGATLFPGNIFKCMHFISILLDSGLIFTFCLLSNIYTGCGDLCCCHLWCY